MARNVIIDQARYLKIAEKIKRDNLAPTTISKAEADDDSKYADCVIVDVDEPLPGQSSLPPTAFLDCDAE